MQDQIKPLTGAQRVRLRPAVVFGDDGLTGAMGALEMLINVLASECYHGFADKLMLTSFSDGSMEIQDNGRGLYLGSGKAEDDSVWKDKLCDFYCGSAFPEQSHRNREYSYFEKAECIPSQPYECEPYDAFDLCAVQYASEFMDVTVCRDGLELALHFEKGENVGGISVRTSDAPSGTLIRLKLDSGVFSRVDIPEEYMIALLKMHGVLCPNCRMIFRKVTNDGIRENVFCFPKGSASYLEEACSVAQSAGIYTGEIKATGKDRYNHPEYGARVQVTLGFSKDSGSIQVFHNRRPLQGGRHLSGILEEIRKRIQWQLNCDIDSRVLAGHLHLILITTATKNSTLWENGPRTRIGNGMICDMARDCVKDAFSQYIKTHRDEIASLLAVDIKNE
jgi:DNA gyrase subunit B